MEASRQLTYHAVDAMNGGKQAQREITMAKLFATELAQRLTYDCQQIFGGFGYTTEYPIGRICATCGSIPSARARRRS